MLSWCTFPPEQVSTHSIVVPMEGSGDESFEVILCGGEMEAPIAMMEAPTRATNGHKGKRRSKGEANTNGVNEVEVYSE